MEQVYRRRETIDRISIRRALPRLLAGPPQILDRLADVIAASVMMRQFAQMIVQSLGVKRLYRLRCALMQQLTALDQQRAVRDLLRQRVLEGVLDVLSGRL